jgi:hypothetical protein
MPRRLTPGIFIRDGPVIQLKSHFRRQLVHRDVSPLTDNTVFVPPLPRQAPGNKWKVPIPLP